MIIENQENQEIPCKKEVILIFYICFLLNNYQYEITQKSFIPMRFNHNDRI
jgi:hypothetical protein